MNLAVAGMEQQVVPSLKPRDAAAFLGIGENTVRRLIKEGYIRAFRIPHTSINNAQMIRIRMEELERIVTENDTTAGITGRNRSHWINPHTVQKIPVALAARIIGIKPTAVSEAIQRGTLVPTPEGLHDYILLRREKELRANIRQKYRNQIRNLQRNWKYTQKQLTNTLCRECRTRPVGMIKNA